jgi:DNA-binding transcriptional MerR regulator
MLDLPPATIRTWESRYGLVVPERSPGGQRLYSRAQVEQLRFVTDAVRGGSRPAEAHRLLEERLGEHADVPPAGGKPRLSIALADSGDVQGDLLRQLLELDGFVVTSRGEARLAVVGVHDAVDAALCRELKERGDRVLALVAPGTAEPAADAVLRLPVEVGELLEAARTLARL